MAKSLKRHPTNMADKHMKRCSIWLVIREMQVKSTIRHQYIQIYVSFLKSLKSDHSTLSEDIKKKTCNMLINVYPFSLELIPFFSYET